jgi:aconitate hydratase
MGILPLQYRDGESAQSLGLTGRERFYVEGVAVGVEPGQEMPVRALDDDGAETSFTALSRIDTPVEVEYYRHGGILPFVLRELLED